ncbi:MAG TPA: cupin domain-containing protein [Nocardioides sp.]|nr:cupin domain-containing protein [Nocardioides sp.]
MTSVEIKDFHSPEEKRPFVDKGQALVIKLGDTTVIKGTFEPGWHWKEHVAPIAGTASCQSPHLLYVLSGRMAVRMDDGTEAECGPDEAVRIDPGHDAWVVGDVACVTVDFGVAPTYAQHKD